MTIDVYYAVSKRGQACIFTSVPVRNEHFGIWEGNMDGCISSVVSFFEADGFEMSPLTFKDEPMKLRLSLEYG